MSADNRLGRLGALVSAIAIGSAGVGGVAAAASEGRFQAIVEPGSMPNRAVDRLTIDIPLSAGKLIPNPEKSTESAEAPEETTPEYEVYSTIQDRVSFEPRESYFSTLHDRLFGDPAPYFRISYATTDENYYTRVEASYFQNGGSAVIREGTIPDVHTIKMFPDGNGFLGSTEVDLLIKPDGTLDGSDAATGQISLKQIKELTGKYFVLPDDWEDMDWDETVEGLVIKQVKYRDAFVAVGGYLNGVIFSYFEPLIPDDTQSPDPSLGNPVPTPLPNNLG